MSLAGATPGCAPAGGAVLCETGPLAAGATANFALTVTVDDTVPAVLLNTATATAAEQDPRPTRNTAGVAVTALGLWRVYLPLTMRLW